MPRMVALAEAQDPQWGGKARGLARLIQAGLQVPPGFVAVGGVPPSDELQPWLGRLNGSSLAVRSSASWEDHQQASAAGQFLTRLEVPPEPHAIRQAMEECRASLTAAPAETYGAELLSKEVRGEEAGMAVVVQQMVAAVSSGVLFTQDPRQPKPAGSGTLLIETHPGQGEQLVAGRVNAFQYRVARDNQQFSNQGPLSAELLQRLIKEALWAESQLGEALDLEWSIDARGQLYWLQARSITTLDLPQIDELDHLPEDPQNVWYTRANVGEMLPGAATPLTMSVFGEALNHAMRRLYVKSGGLSRADRDRPFVASFSNHLFFDLNQIYAIAGRVAGTTCEALEISLLGRTVSDRPPVTQKGRAFRLFNFLRYLKYLLGHKRALAKLPRLVAQGLESRAKDTENCYQAIDAWLPNYRRITARHLQVSAWSGAFNGALRALLEKGGLDRALQQQFMGELLSRVDGVESAAIIQGLEAIAAALPPESPPAADKLLAWLQSPAGLAQPAGRLFATLLSEHGHRCVREAELRERPWRDQPQLLVTTLAAMRGRPAGRAEQPAALDPEQKVSEICSQWPKINPKALHFFTRHCRQGVRKREYSKSLLIQAGARLRDAYRELAQLLEQDGQLPDPDLIFFLSHAELGQLVAGQNTQSLQTRARHRQRLYPQQMDLRFADFCRGIPQPIADVPDPDRVQDTWQGMAVSPGRARGLVRVLRSPADAQKLRPGEILCAEFTDVGWTPLYSLAAGLLTEIGSTLSHGAVVAREYGLPLVSALDGITRSLKTGDQIEMDGGTGKVIRIKQ